MWLVSISAYDGADEITYRCHNCETLSIRIQKRPGRKGKTTKHQIDRHCPFQVAIPIPLGGSGERLMGMHAFCREHAMTYHTKSDHRDIGDFTLFCFSDPAHANAFNGGFGGEQIMLRRLAVG
jgi:hypothetical protein